MPVRRSIPSGTALSLRYVTFRNPVYFGGAGIRKRSSGKNPADPVPCNPLFPEHVPAGILHALQPLRCDLPEPPIHLPAPLRSNDIAPVVD